MTTISSERQISSSSILPAVEKKASKFSYYETENVFFLTKIGYIVANSFIAIANAFYDHVVEESSKSIVSSKKEKKVHFENPFIEAMRGFTKSSNHFAEISEEYGQRIQTLFPNGQEEIVSTEVPQENLTPQEIIIFKQFLLNNLISLYVEKLEKTGRKLPTEEEFKNVFSEEMINTFSVGIDEALKKASSDEIRQCKGLFKKPRSFFSSFKENPCATALGVAAGAAMFYAGVLFGRYIAQKATCAFFSYLLGTTPEVAVRAAIDAGSLSQETVTHLHKMLEAGRVTPSMATRIALVTKTTLTTGAICIIQSLKIGAILRKSYQWAKHLNTASQFLMGENLNAKFRHALATPAAILSYSDPVGAVQEEGKWVVRGWVNASLEKATSLCSKAFNRCSKEHSPVKEAFKSGYNAANNTLAAALFVTTMGTLVLSFGSVALGVGAAALGSAGYILNGGSVFAE